MNVPPDHSQDIALAHVMTDMPGTLRLLALILVSWYKTARVLQLHLTRGVRL